MGLSARSRCAASGCVLTVSPKMLMCREHWRQVPRPIQFRILRHYQAGQERPGGPQPTSEYFAAIQEAIAAVGAKRIHAKH